MSDSAVVPSLGQADPFAVHRRVPIGAEYLGNGQTHVRLWAPKPERVTLVVNSRDEHALGRDADGYVSATIAAMPGAHVICRAPGAALCTRRKRRIGSAEHP